MTVDLLTASLFAMLVGNVAGAVFIVDTLLRRDDGPGRVWAFGFLSGMATTIAYAMWSFGTGGVFAIAVGNALFASTTAIMWIGSRRFNQRPLRFATFAAAGAAVVVAGAVLIEGPAGGDWAGWPVMSIAVVVFSLLAALETMRRPMGRFGIAWALAIVFVVVALFYAVRVVVFFAVGPEAPLFHVWFGSVAASVFTVVLTIVAVVVTSVLRSTRSELRSYAWMSSAGITSDGIMLAPTFLAALGDIVERAGWRTESVAVIAVRIEDVAQIRTAFGADVAGDVVHAWRQGVRRYAPSTGLVGEDGENGLLVVARVATAADARRQAATIYRGLFESLGAVTSAVIPVVGVGVALSETVGYRADALVSSAHRAAADAATSIEASVLFGGVDEALEDLS